MSHRIALRYAQLPAASNLRMEGRSQAGVEKHGKPLHSLGSPLPPDSIMLEESIPYMIEPLGKWKPKDPGWADKERT